MNTGGIDPVARLAREGAEKDAQQIAQKMGLPYVDLVLVGVAIDALRVVPAGDAQTSSSVPFLRSGKKLSVASPNPQSDAAKKLQQQLESQKYQVQWYVCSEPGLADGIKQYGAELLQKKAVEVRENVNEADHQDVSMQKLHALGEQINKIPAAQALTEVLLRAIALRASDVHFQPTEALGAMLRLRIDGVLHEAFEMDREGFSGILTRIKFEAGMRANVADVPQDGAMHVTANGREVELRVSALPVGETESVVLRVLDSNRGINSFSELGFADHTEKKIISALHRKNGIVLVTGPTGSGKTTTLYSMLAELNTSDQKLVTLEDPIEYHLPGISQSQVNEDREFNFETGFKSLLRHDPDVILVGEIRTLPTARLAFEAALTGHTVLSSLHTNSATGAISRLRNMGMDDFNIAPTVSAVFAQRLVRRVCPHCVKKMAMPTDEHFKKSVARLQQIVPNLPIPSEVSEAAGCEKCSGIGYDGQVAVTEAFLVDEKVRDLIQRGAFETEIREYLRTNTDALTLWDDGVLKILEGTTTLEEVQRVVGEQA